MPILSHPVKTQSSYDSLSSCIANFNLDTYFALPPSNREEISCTCENAPCRCFTVHQQLIGDLERDLSTAAEVGQALVQNRLAMQQEMDRLNEQLETINRENRELLGDNDELIEQLAALNGELEASDSRISELSDDLGSARSRISKLNAQNMQTNVLEQQIHALEFVRESLQQELQMVSRDMREAESRWRKSERLVERLGAQYDRLEQQTYSESTLNRESTSISNSARSTMQGFVKFLLQENAALDATVAELQERITANNLDKSNRESESERAIIAPDQVPTAVHKEHAEPVIISNDQVPAGLGLMSPLSPSLLDSYLISPPPSNDQLQVCKKPSRLIVHKPTDWDSPRTPDSPLARFSFSKTPNSSLGRAQTPPPPDEPQVPQTPLSPVEVNTMVPRLRRAASHESILSVVHVEIPAISFSGPRVKRNGPVVSLTTTSNVDVFAQTDRAGKSSTLSTRSLLSAVSSVTSSSFDRKKSAADSLRSAGESTISDDSHHPVQHQKSWATSLLTKFRGGASIPEESSSVPETSNIEDDNNITVVPGIGFAV